MSSPFCALYAVHIYIYAHYLIVYLLGRFMRLVVS